MQHDEIEHTDAEIELIQRIVGLLFCILLILLLGIHHLFPIFVFIFIEQCCVWIWTVYKKDIERHAFVYVHRPRHH